MSTCVVSSIFAAITAAWLGLVVLAIFAVVILRPEGGERLEIKAAT
jgi:hypothetical protein